MIGNDGVTQDPFSAVLEAAVDGIIVIDNRAIIQIVNSAATRLFAYEKKDLIGKNVMMLMPRSIGEHHDDYIRRYLETGERKIIGVGLETLGQKKDLSCFPMYISVGEIVGNDGSRFVGIIRDLTSQRRKEDEVARVELEIRKLRERLIHASRISTLGEMVTGISHEVNQPLTAIATYAQGCSRMINAGLDDPRQLLDALGKIGHQAERSAKVISRIRHFSKKVPSMCQPNDCNEIIVEVVSLAEVHAAESDVSIDLNLAQSPKLVVMADAIQIQQVLMNLINNAIESMMDIDGDRIVTVQSRSMGPETVQISVSDLGIGLEDGVGEEVFDAFYSTKPDGLGIGLSLCRSLLSAQGGRIEFHRNSGRGSTVSFTLPTAIGE